MLVNKLCFVKNRKTNAYEPVHNWFISSLLRLKWSVLPAYVIILLWLVNYDWSCSIFSALKTLKKGIKLP